MSAVASPLSTAIEGGGRKNNSQKATMIIGERVLLPCFKLAYLVHIEPDGRKVFKDDDFNLVCEHGERASTIHSFLLKEKLAKQNGLPIPARSSECTCQTTEGMHKTNVKLTDSNFPPARPVSLFEHVSTLNTDQQTFKGREAVRIPFTRDEWTTYITNDGRLVCKHGRARATLLWDGKQTRKYGKVPQAACGCKACPIPRRTGHNAMKLGTCGNRRLTKKM